MRLPVSPFPVFAKSPFILRLFFILGIILSSTAFIAYMLEPYTFDTYLDALWWAVITASTVGYGDIVPQHFTTRALTAGLIFVGFGVVTLFVTSLASTFMAEKTSWQQGRRSVNHEDHIIVIGWNERALRVISHLKHVHPETPIVILDSGLTENPYPNARQVDFVKGAPSSSKTLEQANTAEAKTVLLTAGGTNGEEEEADARTMLILLAVKNQNPDVYTAVELLTNEHMTHAERAGADEIVNSTQMTSLMLAASTYMHGAASLFAALVNEKKEHRLRTEPAPEAHIGRTFYECLLEAQTKGSLPIGIKRSEDHYLNPDPEMTIQSSDELIMLTN
ncbi:voltage-gated potassium channel [Salsuginibacillus halophilus]|uniref:Voltage-gated potassium channel n=1 Tax=Salsuginibacillus halophilus TaxID=517424 RepID=A0A2P8HE32_9BACI|nr:potassium channel protein [Salsuginibacillus halophilus]PSL44488.1 voltage-gated potassium channel [Salsuginibacillus halophilus]